MKLYATLYHGTGTDFDEIDLSIGASEGMEFGAGFYVTPDFETAKNYAILATVDSGETPLVYEYEFDSVGALLDERLDIRKFDKLDLEWFNYVSDNLHNKKFHNNSTNDIIIGPLERGDAWEILRDYSESRKTYEETVSLINEIEFKMQVVFKTELGLKYLTKVKTEVIK